MGQKDLALLKVPSNCISTTDSVVSLFKINNHYVYFCLIFAKKKNSFDWPKRKCFHWMVLHRYLMLLTEMQKLHKPLSTVLLNIYLIDSTRSLDNFLQDSTQVGGRIKHKRSAAQKLFWSIIFFCKKQNRQHFELFPVSL